MPAARAAGFVVSVLEGSLERWGRIARGTQGYVGWGDAFVDFDNDRCEDCFLVNGPVYPQVDSTHAPTRYLEPELLFVNQRDGTFRNASKLVGDALQIPQVSRGLAIGDLFNDRKMEAVRRIQWFWLLEF